MEMSSNDDDDFMAQLYESLSKSYRESIQDESDGRIAPEFPYFEDKFAEEFGNRASNVTSQVKERRFRYAIFMLHFTIYIFSNLPALTIIK